ncbi:MAG: LapA family protein [Betaproteobacteria bacterium]|jgi:uncharacterized integral membrane protein|nr:LapA family protein [Betaproteobacteria bacterium]
MVMSLRALFLILVFVVLAIFTVLNWSAFMSPTTLSLLFASVQAPLGLIMLVVTALLAALFLTYLAYVQTTVILDARRSARELAAQRDLADQAEASRFTELRSFLEGRLQQIETAVAEAQSRTGTRVDRLESELRAAVERTENTLAAYIGELEDRMERRTDAGAGKPAA